MRAYIRKRNDANERNGAAHPGKSPDPRSDGAALQVRIFPNPRSGAGRLAVPKPCKGAEWALSQWTISHERQPSGPANPAWAFFFKTDDQFEYFQAKLTGDWAGLCVGLGPGALIAVQDVTAYELLGAHELLLTFTAPFSDAQIIRDLLLRAADNSPGVQAYLIKNANLRSQVWDDWRQRNNVTAFCFPSQRSRVSGEGGAWTLSNDHLRRTRPESFQNARAIKAFIKLVPKSDHTFSEIARRVFLNTLGIAERYAEIVERIYHYPEGRSLNCGFLGEHPNDEAGYRGFSLDFKHRHVRAMLIEILIPCGKFSLLNRLSEEFAGSGILDVFIKSTYIAYHTHFPQLREQATYPHEAQVVTSVMQGSA